MTLYINCCPRMNSRKPFPASPGMTGTGAPVTEQLRCLIFRRIRVVPRFTSPLLFGGGVFSWK